MKILGIDVGGSGIKGAIGDTESGEMLTERVRIETPKPATPEAMAKTVKQLTKELDWKEGPIGVGFPAIIKGGRALSAANIDKSWIGTSVSETFSRATDCPVMAVNDADAAGVAAVTFGAGKGQDGVVMLITIGSGLGSALFMDGKLVPNSELGHIRMEGMVAEHYASSNARKKFDLSWEEWALRFNKYLVHIKRLFTPDLVLLGGGASKKWNRYEEFITVNMPVKPAELKNEAGIIGAAYYAYQKMQRK